MFSGVYQSQGWTRSGKCTKTSPVLSGMHCRFQHEHGEPGMPLLKLDSGFPAVKQSLHLPSQPLQ